MDDKYFQRATLAATTIGALTAYRELYFKPEAIHTEVHENSVKAIDNLMALSLRDIEEYFRKRAQAPES